MIQEVVGGDAELELLLLGNPEILEQRQVVVKERRSPEVREDERSVVSGGWQRKATAVDELVRPEIFSGVAGQHWLNVDVGRAVDQYGADAHAGGGGGAILIN